MGLTGFDSEADRRDAIRNQLVEECVWSVHNAINEHGVTKTNEERRWLELRVAAMLIQGLQVEFMSETYRQEIATAEKEIDGATHPKQS